MAITFDKLTKVIEIESPAIEVTIQDLVNAIRDWQDELDNIETPNILSAAGKEALGGGVSVGVTMTLLNGWKVAFQARAGPEYVQCTVSGGNLVSEDESNPIYPTAFTQIVVTASSSATTSDIDAIQYSSYGDGVSVDIINGQSGTDYPIGNQEFPVDNLEDAVTIANSKGFKTLYIRESMIIDSGTVISNFKLVGRSHVNTKLTIDTNSICDGITISNANVTGILDGGTHIEECSVGDITYVNGHIHHCGLYGTMVLDGNKDAVVENCFTVDQDSSPTIDMGGTGQDLALPNYSGIINIRNFSDATGEIGIGLSAGMVILESDITAGTIIISGSGLLQDNTTGTAYVNKDGLMNRELITKASWDTVHIDAVNGQSGTVFPTGTLNHPVDNLADAILIANANKIVKFEVDEDLTLTQNVSDFSFSGFKNQIINLNGQTCSNSQFYNLSITGTQASSAKFEDCHINNVQGILGSYKGCVFPNTTPMLVASGNTFFNDCRSAVPGNDSPIFDFSNGSIGFNNRAFSGGIKIVNSTDSNNTATVEFIAGKFNFDNSNTDGYFAVRGVIDTSGIDVEAGATVAYTGSVTTNRELEYNGKIFLDTSSSTTGSVYPFGLPGNPVNNLADALTLANEYNTMEIQMAGALTITTGQDISNQTLRADRSLGNTITVDSGAITDGTYFENLTVSGTMNGSVRYTTCVLGAINNFDGGAKDSLFTGTIDVTGTGANYITNCDTYVTSSDYTTININSSTFNIIRCRGRYGLFNKTSTDRTSCDLVSGLIYIDSTCTAGQINIGGIGSVSDNSAAGCTVSTGALSNPSISDTVWDETTVDHTTAGTMGKALSDAGSSGNPWATPISGNTTAGSFGELVGKKLLTLAKWLGMK